MKSYITKISPFIAGALIGCAPDDVNLNGSVQKGPFIQGSDIQIYLLDTNGNNLGSVYNTQTSDNLGNFSTTMAGLPSTYSGNLSLSGDGFFFKEVAGRLSDAQQTLKALYAADGNSADININLVTHLSYQRALQLLKNNSDLNASVAQAQNELISTLASTGLVYPSGSSGLGTSMDLFGQNNGANNYLLAVSCAFENAAGSSDSALQDLLNAYQLDLADDGAIASSLNDKVRAGVINTEPSICVENLEKRAQELGVTFNLDVNSLNSALDTDLDNVINSQDTDIDGDGSINGSDQAPYNLKVVGSSFCEGTLCWEITTNSNIMTGSQGSEYCGNSTLDGKNNWRMPTIGELRTLVKGCPNAETGGACGADDNCSSNKSCNDKCLPCEFFDGPGENGCYWDPLFKGECGDYISSSKITDSIQDGKGGQTTVYRWYIDFTKAWISKADGIEADGTPGLVRCVRDN